MAPQPDARHASLIAVFRSPADFAPALAAAAALGLGTQELQIVTTSALPQSRVGAPGWLHVANGQAAADALADRLWSGGRYGLIATAIAVAFGLVAASILLAVPEIGTPVQRGGFLSLLFMAMGGAASVMPVGLPLGAILEECKVEGHRKRFRTSMGDGHWFLFACARRDVIEAVTIQCRSSALDICRIPGQRPLMSAEQATHRGA